MLPSETMIWQPEFTDKTLSRKPGAVQSGGGRHNAAEKALCAICLGNKNSYDLCQILSPKRPTQLRELRYIAD
ncbi:hypothetical protein ACEPRG_23115, partial [Escherichia coli]